MVRKVSQGKKFHKTTPIRAMALKAIALKICLENHHPFPQIVADSTGQII
jgi:hypothetical protein